MTNSSRRKYPKWLILLAVYLILLLISHIYRSRHPVDAPLQPGQKSLEVRERGRGASPERMVRIAYRDAAPPDSTAPPVVLLLHGSPVGTEMFYRFIPELSRHCRVLAPDFPGYGASGYWVSDYSLHAFAEYMRQFLDRLQIDKVHLVGYSLGGGVGIELAHLAPERVASLTLLSAIGVQEFELLGDYHLNHAVHGAQLFLIWLLQEGTPHFGRLDHFPLNLPYARSFYDSDQRPLREYLQAYQGPMLIQHGPEDGLVPFAAAREHQRIVPQSVLQVYERGGHGIVIGRAEMVAGDICRFIETVEAGAALTRAEADPQRIAAAAQPLESDAVQKAEGITLFVFIILIALATFVSEDLACIGAGLMAARGIIGFLPAVFASFLGIFVGDMLLYLAGRYFGKPALKYPPLKWMIKADDIVKSADWFREKGPRIILASRFLPGSRLPTYFGAGMLDAGFWMFTFYFGIAALAWTPLLVGLATLIGEQLLDYYAVFHKYALLVLLGAVLLVWSVPRLLLPLFSHKGRRLLLSRWRRLTRWEFWPPYVFYVPVFFYVIYLGLRHRSLTLFTAANPGIPAGGFIGESKSEILDGLQRADSAIARYRRIDTHQPLEGQIAAVTKFMDTHQLNFPVVLKPDAGQRGSGVGIIHSETQLRDYLRNNGAPAIVQEYVPGEEFGVFYYRYPGEESGHIFSITDKRFIAVCGDGQSTLETLILNDQRAVCMARFHLAQHRERLQEVPAAGATVPLVELGTHCRGALFLDGSKLITPELSAAIDAISREFEGFYFGRYDIRTPSREDFRQGKNFKVVELNGVTSEATNIYDPANSLLSAYRTLARQWRLAFEIGRRNRERGVSPTPAGELLRLLQKVLF